MKVVIKYEEVDDKALHMTLRLTLPQKYIDGPTSGLVKLFVDHYNKKHEPALVAEDLHVKIVGGDHLRRDTLVSASIRNGDECYLMGEDAFVAPVRNAEASAAATPATGSSSASAAPTPGSKPSKPAGMLRCKRFGCQMYFDPAGPPQECTHHKGAPIFHETAKWWSCCPNSKAYDFDDFMRIPGCQKGFCSAEGQEGKRFLGGCDLRADSAPVRLDADGTKDARAKLRDLRRGLVAIGMNTELFEQVYEKQMATDKGDADKVCERFRTRFAKLLDEAS